MIEFVEVLPASAAAALLPLVAAAAAADEVAPLSEQALLRLDRAHTGVAHALARDESGEIVGYAQLGLPSAAAPQAVAEMFVAPPHRRHGVGRALLNALQTQAPTGVHVWAHGDQPAAAGLASQLGFARSRVLLQLRRPLAEALPGASWPAGVTVRTFIPGHDEQAWLVVNSAAFANHPEQGRWTLQDVEQREASDWFDPAGFFLAERGSELIGFHWTKVHRKEIPPIGEVYVVGVRPEDSSQGLGAALTLTGLHYLRSSGLTDVLLYVDEDNGPAMKTYQRLGFRRWACDVLYASGG